jgi:cytochrome P450
VPAVCDLDADNLLLRLLLTPEGRQDPYPWYRELRERARALRTSFGPLVLSGYDECLAALRDPRLGRGTTARMRGEIPEPSFGGIEVDAEHRQAFFERAMNNMLFADPPDHTRLRKLVSRAFTPQRVERLRDDVQRLIDGFVDTMADAGEVDVMTVLAFPLPVTVIGELLGVPEADRAGFQPLVRAGVAALDPTTGGALIDEAIAASDTMRDYFADLLAARRRVPTDDLMSGMAASREAGDELSDEEIISTALLLFAAGFETTTNLIGNGLLALLRHPDQQRRWRDDPALDRTGVDELLRWDSPVQLNMRTALEPADVSGEPLARGDIVIVLQAAANRDPDHFADAESLDVGRVDNVPLSFGWGIHHCLGAPLARLEGEVVFGTLLRRFSSIELLDDAPRVRPNLTLRGLESLHVRVAA